MRALEDLSSFTSLSCLMMILATDALRSCSTERVMIPVKIIKKLECGPMPNLMAALPNTGGALCSTPQSLVDAQYWNAVQYPGLTLRRRETRWNLQGCLKLANRSQPLVGRSSPYYEDMWRRYCCLILFFPTVDTCLSCEDIARQICGMVPRWRLFMAALCNGARHYVFALWFLSSSFFLWPPYEIGGIIFLPCGYYLSFYLFPRLISAAGDWMSTILPHMVWP